MDDKQFLQLIDFLGFSWQGYRKVRKGVKKRIRRHMQRLGCRDMGEYMERLEQKEEFKQECERMMTVSVSRFFRDQRLWELLKNCILPELIEIYSDRVKVWSAGCACGEEVYSLMILWNHMDRTIFSLPALDITATDLNPLYLNKAKDALYPVSSLKKVPENLRTTFFQSEHGEKRFRVKPALRDGIAWLTHDFFLGPPGNDFHLILIRNNLLTYYKDDRIRPVLDEIIKTLCLGGYMIIGSHEKLPFHPSLLKPCPTLSYVFKKGV